MRDADHSIPPTPEQTYSASATFVLGPVGPPGSLTAGTDTEHMAWDYTISVIIHVWETSGFTAYLKTV